MLCNEIVFNGFKILGVAMLCTSGSERSRRHVQTTSPERINKTHDLVMGDTRLKVCEIARKWTGVKYYDCLQLIKN